MSNATENIQKHSMPTGGELVHVDGLEKHYYLGQEDVHVLRGVKLNIRAGEWLAILGASGSGKSTLLHLIGGLDVPDAGKVVFNDRSIFGLAPAQRDRFRNEHVGFVFQFYHLLPELNVLENTMLAGRIGRARPNLRRRATEMLERLGLSHRLRHTPKQLSGGERQRVAIARALINEPELLLADEPTGNLDRKTGESILDLFRELHTGGQTIVMVTHDPQIADLADRQLTLDSGRLVDEPT